MDSPSLLTVMGLSALAILVLLAITAVVARRLDKYAVIDVTWGLLFVGVAWVGMVVSGFAPRSVLVAALVTAWGGRLAWHLWRRTRGMGEDPRYVAILSAAPAGKKFLYAVRRVFLTQGVIAWFVSLPLQVTAWTSTTHPAHREIGLVGWIGAAVVVAGLLIEGIGDAQLARFKADPANKGRLMDQGLWSWTRHPNYFGDSVVWWGLWVIAAQVNPGWATVLSPAAMTFFLVKVSGVALLEKSMSQRPGWAEYAARTSAFIPRPPKR
ncbi:MAG: DUF1295 domain-containing protein [Dermatophilaceae bacterium]